MLAFYFQYNKPNRLVLDDSYPSIRLSDISNIKLIIPDRAKQIIISRVLDKCQEIIQKRKEQIEALDELVKSKFIEMFGSPSNNPKQFDVVEFNKIIEYIGDIGSNGANSVISANLKMTDTEDYALMVRTTNFTTNDFIKFYHIKLLWII